MPPPVLGFNNNVRHRGRIFHIQTEDSGVKNPRIVTHLFADGGRIIKTARTDYTQHLERVDLANAVRQMMKAQHKAMYTSLRTGDLDALLEAACGPLPLPPARETATGSAESTPLDSGRSTPSDGVPPASQVEPPSSLSPISAVVLESASPSLADAAASESSRVRVSNPAASRKPLGTRSERSTLTRPSSRYGTAPTKTAQSIFGDGVISEKSLDEVILSYLADDLDGSSE